jgi:hypothetical protein
LDIKDQKDSKDIIRFNDLTIKKLRKRSLLARLTNQLRTDTILFIIAISLLAVFVVLNFLEIIEINDIFGIILLLSMLWVMISGLYILFQRLDIERRLHYLIIAIGGIGTTFIILSYFFRV